MKILVTGGTGNLGSELKKNIPDCYCPTRSDLDITKKEDVVNFFQNNEIDLIINTTEGARSIKDSFSIRQEAQNNNISLTTTVSGAKAFCKAILFIDNFDATDIQSRHRGLN